MSGGEYGWTGKAVRKWKPQTKPNANQTSENKGRSPKGARSLCILASQACGPSCCRAPPCGPSPAPRLPRACPAHSPSPGRTGAEARHPAPRVDGRRAPHLTPPNTGNRRPGPGPSPPPVPFQRPADPGCRGRLCPGLLPRVSLPARSRLAPRQPDSPLRPLGAPRGARDWTPLLPTVTALGLCT